MPIMKSTTLAELTASLQSTVGHLLHALGNQLTVAANYRLASERGGEPGMTLEEVGRNAVEHSARIQAVAEQVFLARRAIAEHQEEVAGKTPGLFSIPGYDPVPELRDQAGDGDVATKSARQTVIDILRKDFEDDFAYRVEKEPAAALPYKRGDTFTLDPIELVGTMGPSFSIEVVVLEGYGDYVGGPKFNPEHPWTLEGLMNAISSMRCAVRLFWSDSHEDSDAEDMTDWVLTLGLFGGLVGNDPSRPDCEPSLAEAVYYLLAAKTDEYETLAARDDHRWGLYQ